MSATAENVWRNVSDALQNRLNPDTYSHWIAVIKPSKLESNTLVLSVSNDFYLWWLEEHYLRLINETIAATCGKDYRTRLEVDPSLPESNTTIQKIVSVLKKQIHSTKTRPRSLASGTMLNPKYVFDTFVVGPSNNFSHASSLAVAQAPGKAYNPLFLYGGIGLGKTHLMQAIGQHVLTRSNSSVCYLSCETMLNEYINSLQNKNTDAFRRKYRNTDVLLIDDVHFLAKKDGLQEEFFHTFNQLFNARKQIVMTSDRPAGEISGLEKRLVSRFEWGLVADLGPPDFETRVAILRSKQEPLNIVLPEEIITFIASHIRSNIRRLEGALIRITSYASIYGKPITMALVEEQLHSFLEQEKTEPATIPAIQRKVADYFDVRVADMTSRHRAQTITLPRQVAMYLCRTMTTASFPEIGAAFQKTHATVLYAHRTIEKKRSVDPQLNQIVIKLSKQLDPNTGS